MSVKPYKKGPTGALKAHSQWLGVSDLPWDRDTPVTIEYAIVIAGEKMGTDDPVSGGGLKFYKAKKQWILPSTCRKQLERMFGRDAEGWIDKEIILYVDPSVMAFGQNTGGIRIRDEKSEAMRKRARELAGVTEPKPPVETAEPDEPEPEGEECPADDGLCGKMYGEGEEPDGDCQLDTNHDGDCGRRPEHSQQDLL